MTADEGILVFYYGSYGLVSGALVLQSGPVFPAATRHHFLFSAHYVRLASPKLYA